MWLELLKNMSDINYQKIKNETGMTDLHIRLYQSTCMGDYENIIFYTCVPLN